MSCDDIYPLIDLPPDARTAEMQAQLDAHLQTCEPCRRLHQRLEQALSAVDQWPQDEAMPPWLMARLEPQLLAQKPRRLTLLPPRRSSWQAVARLVGAAAAVVTLVTWGMLESLQRQEAQTARTPVAHVQRKGVPTSQETANARDGVRLTLLLDQGNATPQRLPEGALLPDDAGVVFEIEMPPDGWLELLEQSPSGQVTRIFPDPDAGLVLLPLDAGAGGEGTPPRWTLGLRTGTPARYAPELAPGVYTLAAVVHQSPPKLTLPSPEQSWIQSVSGAGDVVADAPPRIALVRVRRGL